MGRGSLVKELLEVCCIQVVEACADGLSMCGVSLALLASTVLVEVVKDKRWCGEEEFPASVCILISLVVGVVVDVVADAV